MDWSKAKNTLIIVFLILNICLFAAIMVNRLEQSVSAEALNNTIKILSARNIAVQCEIPKYNARTPSLDYESGKLNKLLIAEKLLGDGYSLFNDSKDEKYIKGSKTLYFKNHDTFIFTDEGPGMELDLSSRRGLEKQLRNFFEGLGLDMSSYILDAYQKADDGTVRVRFTEKYRKFLVFDNYVDTKLTDEGIIFIECKYRKVKGFVNDRADIMPAHQVLLKNFMDDEDITITSIDIGFKGYETGRDMKRSAEGPAWRVMVKEKKEPLYFRASDGKKIEDEREQR